MKFSEVNKKIVPIMVACGITLSSAVLTSCDLDDILQSKSRTGINTAQTNTVQTNITPTNTTDPEAETPGEQQIRTEVVKRYDAPPQNPEPGMTFEGIGDGYCLNPFLMEPPSKESLECESYSDYAWNRYIELGSSKERRAATKGDMYALFLSITNLAVCDINIALAGTSDSFVLRYDRQRYCYLEYNGVPVYGVKDGVVIDLISENPEYQSFVNALPVSTAEIEQSISNYGARGGAIKTMNETVAGFLLKWDLDSFEQGAPREYYLAPYDYSPMASLKWNSKSFMITRVDFGDFSDDVANVSSFQIVKQSDRTIATDEDWRHFTEHVLATVDVYVPEREPTTQDEQTAPPEQ